MTPEESALSFIEGMGERFMTQRVTSDDALRLLAALIRAERTIGTRDERDACERIAIEAAAGFMVSASEAEDEAAESVMVAAAAAAKSIAFVIRKRSED